MSPTALLRLAARRPHVLVVAAPAATAVRVAVEAAVADRRWAAAASPADTDVLVLAGSPGRRLADVADAVWATVPAPRTRIRVRAPGDVAAALDAAAARLARGETGSSAAADGSGRTGGSNASGRPDGSSTDEPPMADLADDDRDGLALDALHVPLGPVLPAWPPGLVVHAVLAGDVITAASAEVLDARPGPGVDHRRAGGLSPDGARLDALARVLDLAGADAAARRARRLRDGDPSPERLRAFGRRVARSPALAWTLRGIPLHPAAPDVDPLDADPLDADRADTDPAGIDPGIDPDVVHRVRRWGRELGTGAPRDRRPDPDDAVAALVGLELRAARLALAALDPDTTRPGTRRANPHESRSDEPRTRESTTREPGARRTAAPTGPTRG